MTLNSSKQNPHINYLCSDIVTDFATSMAWTLTIGYISSKDFAGVPWRVSLAELKLAVITMWTAWFVLFFLSLQMHLKIKETQCKIFN